MARAKRFLPLLLLCVIVLSGWSASVAARGKQPVRYHVSIPRPHTQYVEVSMDVSGVRGGFVDLAMPAWTPGSYLVRDFGRHVYAVRAVDNGGTVLPVDRLDKQTWRVHHQGAAFRVRYRVFADELSVRTSYVDSRFAVLNGPSVYLYVVDQLDRPAAVDIVPPEGWSVYTALRGRDGMLEAADYDALVDAPIVLGHGQTRTFLVDKTTFDYVLLAPAGTNADLDRLANDSKRMVQSFGELLGGFPFSHYTFLVVAPPHGGGGLEHFDSTLMMLRAFSFDEESGYERAAGLAAHEFFHAWNVKRIHDRVLGPFDYRRENYTDLLWFHEGFTSAMAERGLLHAGLTEPADYLEWLQDAWRDHLRRPGRNYEPLTQISRDAWIKGYQPAANHPNTTISYYRKGELVGTLLDLELVQRSAKHGREGSLAGLFRRLWAERPRGASERAITMQDVVRAAGEEAGEDMAWFFSRFVSGTDELPLPAALQQVGVTVEAQASWATKEDADDKARAAADRKRAWSGIVGDGRSIDNVVPGSPADLAGLMLGDEVVAVDNVRVDSWDGARQRMADRRPGDRLTIAFYRSGLLETRELELREDPYKVWSFSLPKDDAVSAEHKLLLDRWLYRTPRAQ